MTRRVAVVGTSFGARIHVPALRAAGFDVVALVGRDPARTARRAERLGIGRAATSLDEALSLGLDAVSIASPPDTHAPLASAAVAAGCHVLCEKPFTTTAEEAESLVATASAAGVAGVLGHEFRWATVQSVTAEAIASGLVGAVQLVSAVSFLPMLRTFEMPGWFDDPGRGGGWLGASGSHLVDRIRTWVGDLEAVSAGLPRVRPGTTVEDGFDIRFRSRRGAEGCLVQCASAYGPSAGATRVVGEAGTLWHRGDEVWLADEGSPDGRLLPVPPGFELPDVAAGGRLADMTKAELPPYVRLAEAFGRAVDGEPPGPGPRPATFADGAACMRVLEAVRRSAADGGRWEAVA